MSLLKKISLAPALIFMLSCGNSWSTDSRPVEPVEREGIPDKFIAHAFGGIGNEIYLNCKECFEVNYEKGFRLFEVDLVESSDGELIAAHGIPDNASHSEFMAGSEKRYTRLDVKGIVSLMSEKTDWTMVSDCKSENGACLRKLCDGLSQGGISCTERVIPQIYHPRETRILDELGFEKSIITLYAYGNKKKKIIPFIQENKKIAAVTMWPKWVDKEYLEAIHEVGAALFIHTLNDEREIKTYFDQGVDGVYTDFYFQQ